MELANAMMLLSGCQESYEKYLSNESCNPWNNNILWTDEENVNVSNFDLNLLNNSIDDAVVPSLQYWAASPDEELDFERSSGSSSPADDFIDSDDFGRFYNSVDIEDEIWSESSESSNESETIESVNVCLDLLANINRTDREILPSLSVKVSQLIPPSSSEAASDESDTNPPPSLTSPQRPVRAVRRRTSMHQVQNPMKPKQKRKKRKNLYLPGSQLYQFILLLLDDPANGHIIKWTKREVGEFRVIKTETVASLWGTFKNNPTMTYDSLSRGLRHYYKQGIMQSVSRKLHYRFTEETLEQWYNRSDVQSPL